jgi:hypothetical protein
LASRFSHLILLTELRHVNRCGCEIPPRRTQIVVLGAALGTIHAPELTVSHKTVAEPH